MGGATSTVGSGRRAGLFRNLDVAPAAGGARAKPAGRLRHLPARRLARRPARQRLRLPGHPTSTTAIASDDGLSAARLRGHRRRRAQRVPLPVGRDGRRQTSLQPQSAFIHAVGLLARRLRADGRRRARRSSGRRARTSASTATPRRSPSRARLGVQIALGTDWTPVGLDEPAARAALRRLAQQDLLRPTTSPTRSCG